MLTQTGSSPRQTTLSALQAYHPAFEMSRRPGGCRHLGAHVGVRVGVGTSDWAHQSASVLVRASSVSENQRALVSCISPGVGAHGRAVRVGESMWGMGAAGREGRAVCAGLGPAVMTTETVRLMGRVAGLQVGQGGQHGRNSGGRDVDGRAGRGMDVIPGVMRVMGLIGRKGQALIHFLSLKSTSWRKTGKTRGGLPQPVAGLQRCPQISSTLSWGTFVPWCESCIVINVQRKKIAEKTLERFHGQLIHPPSLKLYCAKIKPIFPQSMSHAKRKVRQSASDIFHLYHLETWNGLEWH